MKQRAIIPIVSAARSALKGLVDHSFEGVAYGEASLKEFSKQNMRAGALSVTSYSPNGVSNPGFADLIVSNGSINVPYTITKTLKTHNTIRADGTTKLPALEFPAAHAGASADPIFKYLEAYARENNVAIIAPGTQLSFLTIYQSGTVKVNTVNGTIDAPTSGFVLDRIYIPNGDSDSENAKEINDKWKVSTAIVEGAKIAELVNSNGDMLSFGWGNGLLFIGSTSAEAATNNNNCGLALILSRYENGVWKRSQSRLTIGFEPSSKYTFEDWLSTYQTTGAASKKYLNTGDESTGIKG